MHVITRSCVLLFWMQTLTFVKSLAQQCPVIHVRDNVQVIGDPEEANVGNVVQFSCKSRSQVLIGLQELNCDEKGEWSGEAPICEMISCPVPEIENCRASEDDQDYKEHDTLRFQCNPGFKPSDDRPSRCTKLGLRAGWSPAPECEPITCKLQLPSLYGTEYDPSYKSVFSPGDTVTVTCGQSHWISDHLQASAVVSCKEDGQWSLRPVCQEVTCSNRRDPLVHSWDVYWGQQKKLGDEVRYGCKSGYKSTGGATMARCTREGWKPDPLCQAPLDCQLPPPLENGDTKNSVKSIYTHNERVEYLCQAYHIMQGGPFETCNHGEWTGEIRCLKPCTVDEEAMRTHNIAFRYSRKDKIYLAHDDSIQFSCTRGRTVGSVGLRQTCVDGVLHLPSCR
ncbi:coagulation factor XIII B chain-like isoform X2 [Limanda limanda]|uniref:coagulation factor XIII B chain-like isoform X2 n=1 Tax=Limanda limanda TaxID=27771 RepID=UPI0029C8EB2F|nr:coagulation factor XIII B chain-like isoform X2 [Limanda limanda]